MLEQNEHWEKKANGWVFISHSSKDYEDVKIVRNYLERRGFSAIMFYLKSLEDSTKKVLTQDLIKWEIEARNIFVLCDSQYSRDSIWVRSEVDYVKKFPEKIYETIDMRNIKYNPYRKYKELSKLKDLIVKSSLFLSYVKSDREQVNEVYSFLNQNGFQIFEDTQDIKQGDNIRFKIKSAIEETVGKGAVLMFLSQNVLNSNQFWNEKRMALDSDAFIMPILLDDVPLYKFSAFSNFDDSKYMDVKDGFNDYEKKKLIQLIKRGK